LLAYKCHLLDFATECFLEIGQAFEYGGLDAFLHEGHSVHHVYNQLCCNSLHLDLKMLQGRRVDGLATHCAGSESGNVAHGKENELTTSTNVFLENIYIDLLVLVVHSGGFHLPVESSKLVESLQWTLG